MKKYIVTFLILLAFLFAPWQTNAAKMLAEVSVPQMALILTGGSSGLYSALVDGTFCLVVDPAATRYAIYLWDADSGVTPDHAAGSAVLGDQVVAARYSVGTTPYSGTGRWIKQGVDSKDVYFTKTSGQAGEEYVYEANSTDTDGIGTMGPLSISESFLYQYSNTQPNGTIWAWDLPVVGRGAVNNKKVSRATALAYGTSGANALLQLNSSGYLPALNGSLLTNLPAQSVSGLSGWGTGEAAAAANAVGTAGGLSTTIAAGTATLGTSSIPSGDHATVVTVTATNVATTDCIQWGFNGDPHGVTGYAPATTGMLTIICYPSAGQVHFLVVNNTGAAITPSSAITLNWRVVR
jgi:hypothetical protein